MTLTRVPVRARSGVIIWTLPCLRYLLGMRAPARARACLPTTLYAKSSRAASRVALGHQARENLRTDAVHKSFLDAPPKHARLPGPSLLVTMLAVCEVPE